MPVSKTLRRKSKRSKRSTRSTKCSKRSSKSSKKKSSKKGGTSYDRNISLLQNLNKDVKDVLPTIQSYVRPALTDATIRNAVEDYLGGERFEAVLLEYGHMSDWDVSRITGDRWFLNEFRDEYYEFANVVPINQEANDEFPRVYFRHLYDGGRHKNINERFLISIISANAYLPDILIGPSLDLSPAHELTKLESREEAEREYQHLLENNESRDDIWFKYIPTAPPDTPLPEIEDENTIMYNMFARWGLI
jgi:hypothetical protein